MKESTTSVVVDGKKECYNVQSRCSRIVLSEQRNGLVLIEGAV